MPNGVVSFERFSQNSGFPDFESAFDTIESCSLRGHGTIEDEGKDYVQTDFANEFIGGGVLGHGCVQDSGFKKFTPSSKIGPYGLNIKSMF